VIFLGLLGTLLVLTAVTSALVISLLIELWATHTTDR
jgi:hypothetical protein